jgi:hypothetical protein
MPAIVTFFLIALVTAGGTASAADRLPSWNDGSAKKVIVEFIEKVTREGGADYVPQPDRIAVFDNDGTLWSEQPMYAQLAFALDRVKALAPRHPEWKSKQPFKAVLENDIGSLAAAGAHGLIVVPESNVMRHGQLNIGQS